MKLHFLSNGKKHGWNKIRSFFDFFFPFVKYHPVKNSNKERVSIIRCEATSSIDSKTLKVHRDFYTFRAFYTHYFYELFINPFRYYQKTAQVALKYAPALTFAVIAYILGDREKLPLTLIAGAIAFDAVSGGSATTTSLTVSHTCTGSNRFLYSAPYTHGSIDDRVTGVTYNSVSETRINTINNSSGVSTASRLYLYGLINPASGANDVVVSISPSTLTVLTNSSYSGVSQTGQPEVNNTQFGNNVSSLTTTLTTTTNNSWCGGAVRVHNGTVSVGANTTERRSHDTNGLGWYDDSDNPITPAGTAGIAVSSTGSGDILICVVAIAPAVTDLSINLNDTVTVSEDLTGTNIDLNPNVNDAVTVTESLALDFPLTVDLFDSVTVSETITITNTELGPLSVSDDVTVTEAITAENTELGPVSVSDDVAVTESISAEFITDISVFDSVAISESVALQIDLGSISVNDAITITESMSVDPSDPTRGFVQMRSNQQSYPIPMDDNRVL